MQMLPPHEPQLLHIILECIRHCYKISAMTSPSKTAQRVNPQEIQWMQSPIVS